MAVFAEWSESELETFDKHDWTIEGDDKWMGEFIVYIFEKEWTMTDLVESLEADILNELSVEDIREKYKKNKKVEV
jgi:hypothetical protein|tara:strand:+ start:1301 stop:1528 length:228 start_codon:yes stop_codon:yes gene_type:complete